MSAHADAAARKLRKTLNRALASANRRTDPDRHRKHFTAFAHVWMRYYYSQLARSSSSRPTDAPTGTHTVPPLCTGCRLILH